MLNIVAPFRENAVAQLQPAPGAAIDETAVQNLSRFLANLASSPKRSRCTLVASETALESSPLGGLSSLFAPECKVVSTASETAGPVFSVLLALDDASLEKELLVLETSLPRDTDIEDALERSRRSGFEACVGVRPGIEAGFGCVAEDGSGPAHFAWNRIGVGKPSAGFHWFRRASLFVHAAEKAVLRHAQGSGALEIGAAWNEAMLAGATVGTISVVSPEAGRARQVESPALSQETSRIV